MLLASSLYPLTRTVIINISGCGKKKSSYPEAGDIIIVIVITKALLCFPGPIHEPTSLHVKIGRNRFNLVTAFVFEVDMYPRSFNCVSHNWLASSICEPTFRLGIKWPISAWNFFISGARWNLHNLVEKKLFENQIIIST